MSTRCAILLEEAGRLRGIYCHHDGYPKHVGVILSRHFTTAEQVKALVDLGAISELMLDGTAVAYHRDLGEPWEDNVTKEFRTLVDAGQHFTGCWCVYLYVFGPQGWTVVDTYDATTKPLAEVLQEASA